MASWRCPQVSSEAGGGTPSIYVLTSYGRMAAAAQRRIHAISVCLCACFRAHASSSWSSFAPAERCGVSLDHGSTGPRALEDTYRSLRDAAGDESVWSTL